jgi:hypothetical protein
MKLTEYLTFCNQVFDDFVVFEVELVDVGDPILDVSVLRLQVLQLNATL